MHELSIIAGIVNIAEEQVRNAEATQVEDIELEIGELAGVEWQALDFAWDVGIRNSVLETATLQLTRIPGKAQCLECNTVFGIASLYDPCPDCGSFLNEVLQGKELRVKALTVV